MKFSVVTATLNGGPQLRSCIGSVRGQEGVELEHLIEDGCSSDGSLEWLQLQGDLSVSSRADGGMYDALNHGIARASGDVISWLNSDEQYLPGTLRTVEEQFRARPGADVLFGNAILVSPSGSPVAARREIPLRRLYLLNGPAYAMSCTLFFRQRLVEQGLLRFDDSYRVVGDADLLLRIMAAGCRVERVDRYLGLFGVDGANLSTQPGNIVETARMRKAHGARRHLVRRAIQVGRFCEKLVSGCYRAVDLDYLFAIDDIPTYREVHGAKVGPRWTFDPGAEV
jgi:glycosyltransferase involved in cell wall biosynthesis